MKILIFAGFLLIQGKYIYQTTDFDSTNFEITYFQQSVPNLELLKN